MIKSNISQLVFFAGTLFLLGGIFNVFAEIVVRKQSLRLVGYKSGSGISQTVSAEVMSIARLPRRFQEFFFSALSMLFSDDMVTTRFGLAVCFGLFCYLSLAFHSSIKLAKSQKRRQFSPINFLVILAPALCYAVAIILTVVGQGVPHN